MHRLRSLGTSWKMNDSAIMQRYSRFLCNTSRSSPLFTLYEIKKNLFFEFSRFTYNFLYEYYSFLTIIHYWRGEKIAYVISRKNFYGKNELWKSLFFHGITSKDSFHLLMKVIWLTQVNKKIFIFQWNLSFFFIFYQYYVLTSWFQWTSIFFGMPIWPHQCRQYGIMQQARFLFYVLYVVYFSMV